MLNTFKKALTFEDVTMVPAFNRIASRSHTTIHTLVHNHNQNYPFVPANMDTVISAVMCDKIAENNGMMIYHRFCSLDEKLELVKKFPHIQISCGIKDTEREVIAQLIANGCDHFCIDVAHGHSEQVGEMIRYIKSQCQSPSLSIIAGNVCTQDGYRQLVECGANIIKVGVGPGAACTTRMKTGFGVPQFTAIMDCARAKWDLQKQDIGSWMIADGGIKYPRDACIAIAAGADMVMMGSVFSKTQESAGEKYYKEGDEYVALENAPQPLTDNIYSHYRGQASLHFMKSQYGDAKKCVPEGEDFYLKCVGSFEDVLHEYNGSLRSSLTQAGSENIPQFRNNVVFNTTTGNFLNESNTRRSH